MEEQLLRCAIELLVLNRAEERLIMFGTKAIEYRGFTDSTQCERNRVQARRRVQIEFESINMSIPADRAKHALGRERVRRDDRTLAIAMRRKADIALAAASGL